MLLLMISIVNATHYILIFNNNYDTESVLHSSDEHISRKEKRKFKLNGNWIQIVRIILK